MKNKKTGALRTFLQLIPYMKKQIPLFVLVLLLAVGGVALSLYLPILVGEAIDAMIEGAVLWDVIGKILPKMGICIALGAVSQWLMAILNQRAAIGIVRRLREDAFSKLEKLPLSYLDAHPTGDILSRVTSDADTLSDGLLMGFTQLFTGVLTIGGTLAFLIYLNVWIAIAVVVLTPLSLFVARYIAKHTYDMFRLQSKTRGEQTALVDEMIGGQKVVRAFGYEATSMARFAEVNSRLEKASFRATFFSSLTNPSTRVVNNVVYAAVALIGGMMLIPGGWSLPVFVAFGVGDLTTCLAYANQYTKPFNEISGVITELQNAFACADRLLSLIGESEETSDEHNHVLQDVQGRVDLSDVAFSYDPARPLIRDLHLQVTPGMRVAIVGPTGCGKTTLINLLMRFYDVDAGAILVDERDVRDVTRHSLRASYGMVLQDTWIRHATVRDNLTMGRDVTEEELIAACRKAHAHSFIKRLPKGYDTVLSEDGGGLSLGERQLLCIARVMLTRPPMLILDEATSFIDTRTERKIQSAFTALMEGRTTFVVAHRLSTIQDADCILVMQGGQVKEQGTHQELLARGGLYTTLYNSQFEV